MTPTQITSFSGEFRFLSNFHPSPIRWSPVTLFPTVEHGFVWHKTTNPFIRRVVLEQQTPGRAKRFGRKIELRENWDDIKLDIMRLLVFEKFVQNRRLGDMLLDTSEAELIEGNHWHDTFWGVCDGVGENHLGRILMDVRTTIGEGLHT